MQESRLDLRELLLKSFRSTLTEGRRRIMMEREVLKEAAFLPEEKRFQEAVRAAGEKASCPGRRELHYATIE